MNFFSHHSLNLLLLAVAMAIGAHESWADETQAVIRSADQALNRSLAEGLLRTWSGQIAAARRSMHTPGSADHEPPRPGKNNGLELARTPEQPRAGAASGSAPIADSAVAVLPGPSLHNPSSGIPPEPVSLPSGPLRVAIEKAHAKEPDTSVVARARPPESKAPHKAWTRLAKANPVALPPSEASATPPAGFTFKDCDFCPPLVVVPGGEFQMGSGEHPHEKPAHKVKISRPFAIGQYEVTYAEWGRCVDAGACRYRPEQEGSPGAPVGNLSWDDANIYLKWISEKTGQVYRLPSEAEWEYAARFGSGEANCGACGSAGKGPPSTAEPGKQNRFGLHDTAGKRAEWVQDCWTESFQSAPSDGSALAKGDCSMRGLRGGAFGNTSRFRYDRDVRYEANGFRVVRQLR